MPVAAGLPFGVLPIGYRRTDRDGSMWGAQTAATRASSAVAGRDVASGSETDRDEQDVEEDDGYGQP